MIERLAHARGPRLLVAAIALVLAVASCRPADSNPDVQRALHTYAPDLTLGAHVGYAARRRYHLKLEPYLGYRDSSFRTVDGLRDLGIKVDDYVDDAAPRVSPRARIMYVLIGSPDSIASRRVEARLRAILGEPREVCFAPPHAVPRRRLYWPGRHGRGVQLVVLLPRYDSPPASGTSAMPAWANAGPPGAGTISFGVDEGQLEGYDLLRCP